jgi:hypothetical protein
MPGILLNPSRCCCGGSPCSWFGTGDPPASLFWTDPNFGTVELALQNATESADCYWSWCGQVASVAGGVCPGRTVWMQIQLVNITFVGWTVVYYWALDPSLSNPDCFATINQCADVGSSGAVCAANPAAPLARLLDGTWSTGAGLNGNGFAVSFASRPYTQSWTVNLYSSTDWPWLVGLGDCAGGPGEQIGDKTWSISE